MPAADRPSFVAPYFTQGQCEERAIQACTSFPCDVAYAYGTGDGNCMVCPAGTPVASLTSNTGSEVFMFQMTKGDATFTGVITVGGDANHFTITAVGTPMLGHLFEPAGGKPRV